MASVFEVWNGNPKTLEETRCGVYESLDEAYEHIKQNWYDQDGEKFSIVEKISDFDVVNKGETVDPCSGLYKLTMTVRDLNGLLNGKKLYAQINSGEYAIEIGYSGNEE